MKHYIIVKFKDKEAGLRLVPEIGALFEKTLLLDGVKGVTLHETNSERENRYHLMIEMTLTPEGLEAFDGSDVHRYWKATYGDLLESKTIFDCE
ncbi:MAG: hypothetical protein IK104_09240 [Clostridia bacterium]|nr:hypothetical protein [Clostridia bacterium]